MAALTEKPLAVTLDPSIDIVTAGRAESAMRITDGVKICQVCGKAPSIIYCEKPTAAGLRLHFREGRLCRLHQQPLGEPLGSMMN